MMLRTLKKKRVWHVGSPKSARRKASSSQEGTLLSVSEYPRAWERITRLSGDTWMLVRADGKPGVFVNAHAIPEKTVNALLASSGLVAPTTQYVLRTEGSSEYEEEYVHESVHATLAQARAEADEDSLEDGTATIERRQGWKATPELTKRWRAVFSRPLSASLVPDFALTQVLEATGLYDGMWWNDRLDPDILSAPRGGIFQSRLGEWIAIRAGESGYVTANEASWME